MASASVLTVLPTSIYFEIKISNYTYTFVVNHRSCFLYLVSVRRNGTELGKTHYIINNKIACGHLKGISVNCADSKVQLTIPHDSQGYPTAHYGGSPFRPTLLVKLTKDLTLRITYGEKSRIKTLGIRYKQDIIL